MSREARALCFSVLASALLHLPLAAAQDAPPTAAAFEIAPRLTHAAYDEKDVPSAIVHAPAGFDARAPLKLVVFLHGLRGCAAVLMGRGQVRCGPGKPLEQGWDLAGHHDQARTNTLFIVPQLAYMKRDGRPGRFGRPGGFREFLEELLRGPLAEPLGGARSLSDVARIDLVAHSAGYQTALAILERGGIAPKLIGGLVLLDSMYAETARFARYVEANRAHMQLVVISLPSGTPAREAAVLERRLRRSIGGQRVTSVGPDGIGDAILRYPIVFARGRPTHRLVPANHLSEVLSTLHKRAN